MNNKTRKNKSHNSLISVIMPCFNAEHFVKMSIISVLNQSYDNVELLVIDDGSTDSTRKILLDLSAKYPHRLTVLYQDNKGPYPARNLGLKNARGDYIAFLDADDFWHKDFLQKLYTAIKNHHSDIAYCGWQNIGEGAPSSKQYIPPTYEGKDTICMFLIDCPWPIHAALTRKSVIEAVEGFSERYYTSMDYDLWIRLTTITRKFILVPEVLSFYRWHNKGQISDMKWKQAIDAWNVRRDFIRTHPEFIADIGNKTLRQMTHGYLLRRGYTAYWKRDLVSAHRLFRKVIITGYWSLKDIKYLLPSILPERIYCSLIQNSDLNKKREKNTGKRNTCQL